MSADLAREMAEALTTAADELRDAGVSILGGGGLATPDGILRLSVDDVARVCAKVAEE